MSSQGNRDPTVTATTQAQTSRAAQAKHLTPVRYRGFVLIPQADLTWVVRPERSPMTMLPFRAPASSVQDVQALIDWKLNQAS